MIGEISINQIGFLGQSTRASLVSNLKGNMGLQRWCQAGWRQVHKRTWRCGCISCARALSRVGHFIRASEGRRVVLANTIDRLGLCL